MSRHMKLSLATVVATVGACGLWFSASAGAATGSELADEVLATYGVEITDPEVRATVNAGLDEALRLGLIPDDVVAMLDETGTDATVGTELRLQLRDRLQEQLRTQTMTWQVVAPEWREAQAQAMAQLRACQEAGSDETTCAQQFELQLQVQHAVLLQERLQTRLQEVAGLPAGEREAAQTALQQSLQMALTAMERIQGQMTSEELAGVGIDPTLIDGLAVRLREATQSSVPDTSGAPSDTTPGTPGGTTGTTVDPGGPGQSTPSTSTGPGTSAGAGQGGRP